MINYEDILARLHDGDSAEDIAAEMTAALNKAIDTSKREAEEAAAKASEKAAADEAFYYMCDAIAGYLALKAPHLKEVWDQVEAEDLIELVDSLDELCAYIEKHVEAFAAAAPKSTPEDPIAKFLREIIG